MRKAGRRSSRWRSAVAFALAAVLVVGGIVFALAQTGRLGGLMGTEGQTFAAKAGQRATVELPDGTQVKLNAESTLTLPEAFSKTQRTVRLKGEAYFEVTSDAAHPFAIRTDAARIQVKGTAFNVRAYATGGATQVAVTEGAVGLRARSSVQASGDSAEVVLRARDLGATTGAGPPLVRRNVDLRAYTAWTEGRLVFEDTPFEEVVRRLERWYNLEIALRVPEESIGRLNASFDGEPVGTVVKTIAATLDLRYQKEGRRVTFFPPERRRSHRSQGAASVAALSASTALARRAAHARAGTDW